MMIFGDALAISALKSLEWNVARILRVARRRAPRPTRLCGRRRSGSRRRELERDYLRLPILVEKLFDPFLGRAQQFLTAPDQPDSLLEGLEGVFERQLARLQQLDHFLQARNHLAVVLRRPFASFHFLVHNRRHLCSLPDAPVASYGSVSPCASPRPALESSTSLARRLGVHCSNGSIDLLTILRGQATGSAE